ncbi:MAG: flagellar basal body-associated FliL family protein [Endozoicomonas sp. (ex Botrylloides leachii)]|nr:flagellar basal body-associated FliL family protein [Endozoicomonas sp. (ex Botrylloides leachii)]
MQGNSVRKGTLPVILLLAILAGGVGGYLRETIQLGDDKEKTSQSARPNFIPMEPFIVTLKNDARSYYLQMKLSLMSRDPEMIKTLQVYSPMIRNELFRYLSALDHDFISQPNSSEAIREAALVRVNALLDKEQAKASVDDLIITDIVIQ